MKFTNTCLLHMLHTKFKSGPGVSEEKMLTDDDGRQPIAIGHLSDSGNLI